MWNFLCFDSPLIQAKQYRILTWEGYECDFGTLQRNSGETGQKVKKNGTVFQILPPHDLLESSVPTVNLLSSLVYVNVILWRSKAAAAHTLLWNVQMYGMFYILLTAKKSINWFFCLSVWQYSIAFFLLNTCTLCAHMGSIVPYRFLPEVNTRVFFANSQNGRA